MQVGRTSVTVSALAARQAFLGAFEGSGPRRQCAWCLLVMDGAGRYTLQPGRKIRTATHGICPSCKEQMRAEIDAPAAQVRMPVAA